MRKKIYIIFTFIGIITISVFCGKMILLNTINFTESRNYRALELQNINPYAIFGSKDMVLMTENEQNMDYILNISGKINEETVTLEHNTNTGIVRIFDKNGIMLEERIMESVEIARWFKPDRYAEKYYSISPYAYVANNPVKFTDPTGDTINVTAITAADATKGTTIAPTLIRDLSSHTGMNITVSSSGNLDYQKDDNGNPVISIDKDGKELGSSTARNLMISAINNPETAYGFITDKGSVGYGNTIGIDPDQIDDFIVSAVSVDNRTLGYGMTFMHELSHTRIGGGLSDSPYGVGNPGPVATTMNQIRSELNAQGGNFGQRMSYPSYARPVGVAVIPFSKGADEALRAGQSPGHNPHVMHRVYRR